MRFRLWPDTLPGQLFLVFLAGIALLQTINFFVLHTLQESYLRQTLTDRVNLTASRLSLMNAYGAEQRKLALADLSRYYDDSWSVGHAFLARDSFPEAAPGESVEERKIREALQTRLELKGASPEPEARVRIFQVKPEVFQKKYLEDALGHVDARRFPVAEIGMRLNDGAWFVIFQSMQFDAASLVWIQRMQLAMLAFIFWLLFALVLLRVLRPLKKLSHAVECFGKNPEMAAPLPETGSRELRLATHSLNLMRERICDSLLQRNHMLAALAHDLRTPLARLQLRIEGISDSGLRKALLKDCDEIHCLATQGLELARSMHTAETPMLLHMRAFVESIVEDYLDAGHEIALSMPGDKDFILLTRPLCLRRCAGNLIENALRYAEDVEIVLSQNQSGVMLEITDHGPGIPENELENVLKPFYQLDGARNKKTSGVGLGLSIARNMALLAFAELSLHGNAPRGLRARLFFSLAAGK